MLESTENPTNMDDVTHVALLIQLQKMYIMLHNEQAPLTQSGKKRR